VTKSMYLKDSALKMEVIRSSEISAITLSYNFSFELSSRLSFLQLQKTERNESIFRT
jgi:hypothetical protein